MNSNELSAHLIPTTASGNTKATLVAAKSEFVAWHDNVYYFPNYELVTTCINRAFKGDNRQVSRKAVRKIMSVFEWMFLEESAR